MKLLTDFRFNEGVEQQSDERLRARCTIRMFWKVSDGVEHPVSSKTGIQDVRWILGEALGGWRN